MKKVAMKILSCLLFIIIMGSAAVQAQNRQISGTVISKTDNYPVIGATAVEKANPANGVITDLDGNFSITVAPNAELTFSYVGYKSVTLPATDRMNVVLEEENELLQEVVVVTKPSAKPT